MSLGDRVRLLREEAELSQTGLAKASGLTQPDISAIEQGKRIPGPEVLGRISDALGAILEPDEVTEPEERVFSKDEKPKPKSQPKKSAGPRHAYKSGMSLADQLQFPYMILSNATANRLPQTSKALAQSAGPCAAAWDNFLMRYPALREKIETGMIAGDIVALIMAHLPIIQAAREETQRLQQQQAWEAGATPAAA
jgi:transcriptional regulator with XRE-family HTH domain